MTRTMADDVGDKSLMNGGQATRSSKHREGLQPESMLNKYAQYK